MKGETTPVHGGLLEDGASQSAQGFLWACYGSGNYMDSSTLYTHNSNNTFI